MADMVRANMERMVPELEDFIELNIFSEVCLGLYMFVMCCICALSYTHTQTHTPLT